MQTYANSMLAGLPKPNLWFLLNACRHSTTFNIVTCEAHLYNLHHLSARNFSEHTIWYNCEITFYAAFASIKFILKFRALLPWQECRHSFLILLKLTLECMFPRSNFDLSQFDGWEHVYFWWSHTRIGVDIKAS